MYKAQSTPPLFLPLAPFPSSRVPGPCCQQAIHSCPLSNTDTSINTKRGRGRRPNSRSCCKRNPSDLRCQSQRKDWNPSPEVDTRIHWSSPDEGWIASPPLSSSTDNGSDSGPSSSSTSTLDAIVSDLVSRASDSHYEFLGVPANADGESIKASYRKLSKLYHPDTTTLPLEVAAAQFLRLQKAYDVLSSSEERRFYDWNLAQEVSRQQGGGFVWPYEVDQMQKIRTPKTRYVSKGSPEPKSDYLEFSGQIWAALFFDAFALLVAILSAVYVGFFKH